MEKYRNELFKDRALTFVAVMCGTMVAMMLIFGLSFRDENADDVAATLTITEAVSGETVSPRTDRPVYVTPGYLSRYDIASDDDLYYQHLLGPFVEGDSIENWVVVGDLHRLARRTLVEYHDSATIAQQIAGAYPIEGQQATEPIEEIVHRCAEILDIDEPDVFVRNDPNVKAYVSGMGDQSCVVLTSGLLELFEGKEQELSFVIGHELGHYKCGHTRLQPVLDYTIDLMNLIAPRIENDKVKAVVGQIPRLATGRMLTWGRAAEISADRAGLLCCQDEKVAVDALQRLIHGLQDSSPWLNPHHRDFDADRLLDSLEQWESRPLVDFLLKIREAQSSHPFLGDRISALRAWAGSGAYERQLHRRGLQDELFDVSISRLVIKGVSEAGERSDPYLKLFIDGGGQYTVVTQEDIEQVVAWRDIQLPVPLQKGQPVFVQIWDDNGLWFDDHLGTFTLEFTGDSAEFELSISDLIDDLATDETNMANSAKGSWSFNRH
ncbi:MAG: M48 family metalloprotease [Planctomycetota bacterium]